VPKPNYCIDVIIVGARCAGSAMRCCWSAKATGYWLWTGRHFPAIQFSTHYIHQPGASLLNRWGCWTGGLVRTVYPSGTRASILDTMLLDACVEAGAEAHQGFVVEDLVWDGQRVTGIRGHAQGGSTVTETAPLVIGADGLRSRVAEAVRAPAYNGTPPLTCNYYSYFSGVPIDGVELYLRERPMFGGNRTNDGLTGVIVIFPKAEFHEFRADSEGRFFKTPDLAPNFAERVRQGKREEPWKRMASRCPSTPRKPHGTHVACVY
jgi:FAD binding domain